MTSEKKRKLPPRAAARVEQVAKKRTATPPERSLTPAPVPTPAPEPVVEEPPLPQSIQSGHPLPTVENAQSEDLSNKDFQSIQESGVLAESLSRSRQRWITEGIFEKYWTKPTKRKGVVKEEPNNPPKDSMAKIGTITITVEPHVFEATMYGVKDPKPSQTTNSTFRPIMQYGPPNGVMPPPPKPATPATPNTPSTVPPSPSQAPVQAPSQQQAPRPPSQPPTQPQAQPRPPTPSQPQMQQPEPQRPPSSTATPNRPLASPRGLESVLAAPAAPPQQHPQAHPPAVAQPLRSPAMPPMSAQPMPPRANSLPQARPLNPPHSTLPTPAPPAPAPVGVGAKPAAPGAKPATPTPQGADPIIVTLAEKASEDPHLRDLMKRVAIGEAAPHELKHFQEIIDQITAEYKKKGGKEGPSADRLIVDGRTVKYFSDEVRAILDIVLSSNPNQKGSDLRPPPGSDPLVILLVKKALDDVATRNLVKRVAEGKPKFNDTTDLKALLDKLKDLVPKDAPKPHQALPAQNQTPVASTANAHNGAPGRKSSVSSAPQTPAPAASQALRSKGPPPNLKPDISAIVLEFSGGTGDRYLFPKYSMLEYQAGGTQVLASFLIVRKGSKSEYGGDPALDYYQPITIRLYSHSPKQLENIARVVAPAEEVRRYMDDVMDNMTRAEYILLAMRLPRGDKDEQRYDSVVEQAPPQPQPGVLWASSSKSQARLTAQPVGKPLGEDEQYQSFIASVS